MMMFGGEAKRVSKIQRADFTPHHHAVIESITYADGSLIFNDERWVSVYLGAGEEKAVYCICDHQDFVFALEVINEHTYLNGRLIDGEYFFENRVSGLANVQPDENALYRYAFTGLVKSREFIYGYTWDRFQCGNRKSWLDSLATAYLQTFLGGQAAHYRAHYKDAHDRNLMFELQPWRPTGLPVIYGDCTGKLRLGSVTLRGIDLR